MGQETQDSLRAITDPIERAKHAQDWLEENRLEAEDVSKIRADAINEARSVLGMTHAQIARALGITRARVSQLLVAGPPPERAFLGDGPLTVVVGVKPEADPEKPVTATETVIAFDRLRELAATLQLDATREDIMPPGIFDLNRQNLIVLSGPRLFPMVGQILRGDPNIQFDINKDGCWVLRDVATGQVHVSPRDTSGEHRDFGYLARLPRPDGHGNFLCIAGLHATGTQGVVAFLEDSLESLYLDVKTRRFSMIVACGYDPETKQVTSAEPASPTYRWS